ncbi:hypothetical protein [Paracidovorax oryzae]|uniref:hypothetical protein n=1 Tax=Paracidovorax oryzae TaxID=862720 RepID=UPI001FD50ADB|nr:hypothetical protein [Paracidovorax oryzae]
MDAHLAQRAQVGGVRLQALVAWRRPLAFCLACTAPVGFAAEAQDAMLSRSFAHAKIQKIAIERPAAQARFAPEVDCRGLVLDARRVKFFLQHAALTDSGSYRRNAILDDCSADATVVFSDGRTVTVSIDSGTGWGAVSRGQRSRFLACEACVDILQPDFPFDPERRPSDAER